MRAPERGVSRVVVGDRGPVLRVLWIVCAHARKDGVGGTQAKLKSLPHRALHGLHQLLQREGLWQKAEFLAVRQVLGKCIFGIA